MDPGDDMVARVHRVGADRQFLDPEGVDEAGRVERLRPPLGAFLQRIADRLRRGAVDIEDDRLLDGRTLGIGIGLFQPEPADQPGDDRLVQRGGIIVADDLDRRAGARIMGAGVEIGVGQANEAVMHPHRQPARIR